MIKRRVRELAAALLICVCLWTALGAEGAAAQGAAPGSTSGIEALLTLSGLREQVPERLEQLKLQLTRMLSAGGIPEDEIEALERILDEAFDPDEVLAAMASAAEGVLSPDEVEELLSWYRSDLGARFTAVEVWLTTPEGAREIFILTATGGAPEDAERLELARRLTELSQLTDLAVKNALNQLVLLTAIMRAHLAPDEPFDLSESQGVIALLEPQLREELAQMLPRQLYHAYRDFELAELEQYVALHATPAMKKLDSVVSDVLLRGDERLVASVVTRFHDWVREKASRRDAVSGPQAEQASEPGTASRIDLLLDSSGYRRDVVSAVKAIPFTVIISAAAPQAILRPDAFEALGGILKEAMDADAFVQALRAGVERALAPDEVEQLLSWYQSDLGVRIVAAGRKFTDPSAGLESGALGEAGALALDPERAAVIERIAKLSRSKDLAAAMVTNQVLVQLMVAFSFEHPGVPVPLSALEAAVDKVMRDPELAEHVERGFLEFLVQAYGDFDLRELEEYAAFCATPAARKFEDTVLETFEREMRRAVAAVAERLPSL